jgi:hypothetical protein
MIRLCTFFILLAWLCNIHAVTPHPLFEAQHTLESGHYEQTILYLQTGLRGLRGECGTSPNVWALNICQSRKFCYAAPDKVSLWLEKRPKKTVKVLVKNLGTSDWIKFSWKASDAMTLDWPKKVSISSGTTYNIKIWNRKFKLEKNISLYQIPQGLKTITEQAEWMKKNGCQSQAEMLRTEIKSSF